MGSGNARGLKNRNATPVAFTVDDNPLPVALADWLAYVESCARAWDAEGRKHDSEEDRAYAGVDQNEGVPFSEAAANARLIAAAPELLERLKTHADEACLGWNYMFYARGCGCGPCLDRAAIAKADGDEK
jgi:hypothetical protein